MTRNRVDVYQERIQVPSLTNWLGQYKISGDQQTEDSEKILVKVGLGRSTESVTDVKEIQEDINIKIAVSGSDKMRKILEILYSHFKCFLNSELQGALENDGTIRRKMQLPQQT